MIKESVPGVPRVKGVCSKCSKSLFLVTPWSKDIVLTCVSFRLGQCFCPRVWLGSPEMEQSHEKKHRGSRSTVGAFSLPWYFPGILWSSFYQATLPNLDLEAQSHLRFSLWQYGSSVRKVMASTCGLISSLEQSIFISYQLSALFW